MLDDFADPEGDAHSEAYARQCGLLRDKSDRPCYTVMVSTLLGEDGANRTAPAFVASVDRLASKYLRSVSFFASGKVITVLLGNPSDFDEYLHILADELPQMADRVLGRRCRIGVSRMSAPERAARGLSRGHGGAQARATAARAARSS